MFSIDGLVSGFDTTSIIEGLLQFQQTQLNLLNSRKAEITSRQSAFGGIEAQLLSLRSSLGKLNRVSSAFDATTATSSNEDIIVATAGSEANEGTYSIIVNSLATAEQRASQNFASENAAIGTGTFDIRLGDNETTSIQIDESNNTLSGLADAINTQTDDVSASIIFDQGADSYRLLLTSNETGAANTIVTTSNLTGGDNLDFSAEVSAASDATVTLGTGANPITANYSTNQIDNLVSGVTLNLESADAGETVNITIARDTGATAEAIEDFVAAFNSVVDFIDDQTAFNPETNQASPLLGNRNVSSIRDKLLNAAIENVPGLELGLSRLADIGVDIDLKGKLEIDSSRLNDALAGKIEGIDADDIRNLFGLNATSSIQGIEFLVGSDSTVATGLPFEIDITQAAEQASITGSTSLAASTVIDENNNTFSIAFSDTADPIEFTIPDGTYTQEELAEKVQSVINASSDPDARDVNVSVSGGSLVIGTEAYGSNAFLARVTGTAAASLGFDGNETDTGSDVVGRFIVDGEIETAVGQGRVLRGEEGNATTADLQFVVSLTEEQIVEGSEGEITVTRGVTSQIDLILDDILDPETGSLANINKDFDSRIASIDESIDRVNEATEAQRLRLIAEFSALESIIADLQNTGNILAAQLPAIQSGSNR